MNFFLSYALGYWGGASQASSQSQSESAYNYPDPFYNAIRDGNYKACERLLNQGRNPNTYLMSHIETPLITAIRQGHKNIIELLCNKGGNPSLADKSCTTPLHAALGYFIPHALDIIQLLVEKGALINAQDSFLRTPLHLAVSSSNPRRTPIIKYLVESGASLRVGDHIGNTPLHNAISSHHPQIEEVIKYLLEKGAPIEARNDLGNTPLHEVISECRSPHLKLSLISILIGAGANVNARDKYGYTPLHLAFSRSTHNPESNLDVIQLLLSKGALLGAKNQLGKTPLDLALEMKDNTKFVDFLIQSGSPVPSRQANKNIQPIEIEVSSFENKDSPQKLDKVLYDPFTSNFYPITCSFFGLRARTLLIFGALPFYLLVQPFFHMVQLVNHITKRVFHENSMKKDKDTNISPFVSFLTFTMIESTNRIYQMLLSPFYALSLFFKAIYSLYDPQEGQISMNQAEAFWQQEGFLSFLGLGPMGNVASSESNGVAKYQILPSTLKV